MQEENIQEQQAQNDVTIPEMVKDVRGGKMSRRRLITTLTAMGISSIGIGAIVAAAMQHQAASVVHHLNQNDNVQHHSQLHDQHISHQSTGNTSGLHDDYAEHAIVEDSMYAAPLVGRAAIMARKGMGMAAIQGLQLKITNRVVHGNQVSAEWVATGTHNGDLPGMPATGRYFTLRGVTVTIREHDQIVRESIYYNLHDLQQQLAPGIK